MTGFAQTEIKPRMQIMSKLLLVMVIMIVYYLHLTKDVLLNKNVINDSKHIGRIKFNRKLNRPH